VKLSLCLKLCSLGLVAAGALVAVTPAMAADGPYSVQQQWKLGGTGWWDYLAVDPTSHLLYLTRGDHVLVVDSQTGKQAADITGFKGTHGVVFDATGKVGYITDGGSNAVAAFDRSTFKVLATIPAGTGPDGAVFEPTTATVWAFNGRSKNVTVIDTKSNKVVATIALPGKPEFPVADGLGNVYDNIEDTSQIVHFDAKTLKLVGTWPLAPCESPSGLAIDKEHRRLFAVCDGKRMAVVNADTGKVVGTPAIGDGPDAAGFDDKNQLAFSSNGDGTLTVIHEDAPDTYSVVQNVATQRGARTMTIDPSNGRIYLVTAQMGPRPAATPENPRPRPTMVPDSFTVLVVGR
jgi:YVTN family beta-propeller protein